MTVAGARIRRLLMVLLTAALLLGAMATVNLQTADAAFPGDSDWIAFSGADDAGTGDLEIWAVAADGSGSPVNLTANLFLESDPAFSADGTKLAFARDIGGSSAIYVAAFNPSGPSLGTARKISSGPIDGEPAWSPDGTMVAYQRKIVTTMESGNADGADPADLIDSTADFVAAGVRAGDTVKNLTDGSSGVATAVAPTVVTLAGGLSGGTLDAWAIGHGYTIERANRQIFKSPVNGSNLAGTLLSQPGSELLYTDQEPVWSPDGALIAFTSTEDDSNSDIFTMSAADGSSRTNLTDTSTFDNAASRPSWSPDGGRIALQSAEPNVPDHNIWTISKAGGSPDQVTGASVTGADNDLEPAWSPDGSQIAFRRSDTGGNKLFVINANGSGNATRVGSGSAPATNSKPDWRPIEPPPSVVISFKDIGGNVFASDIIWLAEEGITRGCNPPANDLFCPDAAVTRGQMAAFLVRFLGLTESDSSIKFNDTAGNIFEEDIRKLATAGITRGCNPPANTAFCPNQNVTRGQMAAFLVRALKLTDDGGGDLFTDDDGSIFESDIDRLATAGITRGCNPPANTKFCPTSTVTRGQMAAFLHRAADLLP